MDEFKELTGKVIEEKK